MPAMSMASTVCSQLSTWARISASAVTVAVFMGMLLSTTGWRRLRRPAHRGAGAHGATCTIHDTPKRSATIPTRGAKKTVVNGICTCPPSASVANSRAASAWSGTVCEHLCIERDRLLATAIEAQRGLDVQSLSWSMVRDIASTDQSKDGQQLLRGICSGLQSKWVRTAISAVSGPHYLHLSPGSGQDYVPLRLQSAARDCNPSRQDHITCH